MKKAAKKATKKVKKTRGKAKPVVSLNFINVNRLQKGGEHLKISKSGIYFSPSNVHKLGLTKGSFILIALEDGVVYIAKKPTGLFGGYKVSRSSKEGKRLWVNFSATKAGIPLGHFELGKAVKTSLLDHKQKEIKFEAYELIPL